ncbi:hypothetical protein NOCARDAX2BIS_490022 [Nocardioides sp. AX2bis]|nr:hypothetical protein NOCARDAX2BIS_490022 [Nocardioides sp. AX2bis]
MARGGGRTRSTVSDSIDMAFLGGGTERVQARGGDGPGVTDESGAGAAPGGHRRSPRTRSR